MSDAYPEVRPIPGDELSKGVAQGLHLTDAQRATDPDRLARAVAQADRLAASSGYNPGQPIDDQYRQRTYQALLARGEPPAQAQANAEFWARLKASSPENVYGPGETLDEIMAEYRAKKSGEPAPVSDLPTSYQPYAAATSLPAAGPPPILEHSRSRWLGMAQPINRFSLNPGAEYYAGISGPAPSMFGSGDLPIMTGSGVDPSMLRWVAWPIRHTAAFTESRATVLMLIEMSLEGDPEGWHDLVSPDGRAALDAYFAKIATWVMTLPTDADGLPVTELSAAEYERYYGSE
jgi:hypothetical protein